MASRNHVLVAFNMFSNLALSIIIVLLNKWIYVNTGFPNVTLTFLHFLVTFIGLEICRVMNVFSKKSISFNDLFQLSISFCGYVVCTNLSLEYNTVGTYQIVKVLTMPCIMLINSYGYNKRIGRASAIALVPLTLGVYLNSYYDIKFNVLGTFWALIGVLVTSIYQVLVGEKQKELQVNSMQLLYYQAPLSAIFLAVIIPFIEPPGSTIFAHSWSFSDIMMILLTCIVAFLINLNIYWIIGNTSALAYNVLGHCKIISTLVGGFVLFRDPISGLQFIGICFTLFGVLTYTHIKLKEQDEKARVIHHSSKEKIPL